LEKLAGDKRSSLTVIFTDDKEKKGLYHWHLVERHSVVFEPPASETGFLDPSIRIKQEPDDEVEVDADVEHPGYSGHLWDSLQPTEIPFKGAGDGSITKDQDMDDNNDADADANADADDDSNADADPDADADDDPNSDADDDPNADADDDPNADADENSKDANNIDDSAMDNNTMESDTVDDYTMYRNTIDGNTMDYNNMDLDTMDDSTTCNNTTDVNSMDNNTIDSNSNTMYNSDMYNTSNQNTFNNSVHKNTSNGNNITGATSDTNKIVDPKLKENESEDSSQWLNEDVLSKIIEKAKRTKSRQCQCNICFGTYSSKQYLKIHMQKQHEGFIQGPML